MSTQIADNFEHAGAEMGFGGFGQAGLFDWQQA
jgi:hypothetical protein